MSKETLMIKCPFCDQSDYEELESGKYKCLYCETPFYLVDDNITIDLREAHNAHHLYKFSEAELRYFNILKDTTDEKVKVMCNYGRLLAYFGVIFIKDINDNLITTISNYHKDIKSIKETKYYQEIINSSYAFDYSELLDKIDEEYVNLHNELAKKAEYDVFICCKVTPFNLKDVNDRTSDHLVAKRLREELGKKYKVFYSDVDLTGIDYDAQIYSALMRSKILLVVSSNKDYLESSWVQSEWRRWFNFIHEDKKGKQTLVLYKLEGLETPQVFSRVNEITEESKIKDRIDSLLYNLKEKEIKKGIDEASYYLKRGKNEESYDILDNLTNEYEDDYRPWIKLVEWLEYTNVNKNDVRYKKFLNEASHRANEKEKSKILKEYNEFFEGKKEIKKEDNDNIDIKLNEAKTKIIFKKFSEAENIYMQLCEKYIDYRPWQGLFELLVIQNVDKKDDRYKIYLEQALNLCNDEKEKEEIVKEYNELFNKTEPKVEVEPKVKENQSEVKEVLDNELDESVIRVIDNADNIIGNDFFNENYNAYDLQANSKGTGYVVADGENETAKEIVIPAMFNNLPVVAVDKEAFYMNKNIERVVLPDTITQIKDSAFMGCSNLKEIVLPAKLTTISNSAFSGCSNLEKIVLPNKLKKIGIVAFKDCAKITNVVFPNTLKEIHKSAFIGCNGITEVSIPKGVSLIGNGAFAGCSNLEKIKVDLENISYCSDYNGVLYNYDKTELIQYPSGNQNTNYIIEKSVAKIGSFAFYNCTNLENVQFSSNIDTIDVFAFSGCSKLKNIDIPSGLTILKGQAFGKCSSLTDLFIPGNIKTLEWGVFEGCDNLTNVTLEKGVEVLGPYAFRSCKKLENISIPSSVNKIDWQCFDNCINLKEIFIPLSVSVIGKEAFRFCDNLTIHCERDKYVNTWDIAWNISNRPVIYNSGKSNSEYVEEDDSEYSKGLEYQLISDWRKHKEEGYLVKSIGTCKDEDIIIPPSYRGKPVFVIDFNAFKGATIKSIIIPNSVDTIEESAFADCYRLEKITLPASSMAYRRFAYFFGDNLDGYNPDYEYGTFIPDSLKEIVLTDGKEIIKDAFRYCSNVETIVISNTIEKIGEKAFFNCKKLTNVIFEDKSKLEYIGTLAFYKCASIKKLVIPNSVKEIGYRAFAECNWLSSLTIPFVGANSEGRALLSSYDIYKPRHFAYIFGQIKKSNEWEYENVIPSLLKEVIITDGTDIRDGAFYECKNIEKIVLPNTIQRIGGNAFEKCSSLKEIVFSNSVETIGGGAFRWCSSLTSFLIPPRVTCISSGSFEYCEKLEKIVIPEGVTTIEGGAFNLCSSLKSIIIPKTVTTIGSGAFTRCDALTEINIPLNVISMESSVFSYSSNLTIYCEASKKPSEWDDNWNYSRCKVVWNANKLMDNKTKSQATAQINNETESIEVEYSKGLKFDYKAKNVNGWVVSCGKCTNSNVIIPSEYCDPKVMNGASQKVKIIGENAFSNSLKIKSITIPSTITHIKKGAFEYCTNLENVYYEGTIESWCNIIFEGPSSNPMKCANNFYMLNSKNNWSRVKKIEIPNSIKKIGNYQFLNFHHVSNITIPNSVTSIGDSAFKSCNKLANITIPNSVRSIGDSAFKSCNNLANITIPNSVTSIGDSALSYCSSLTSIIIPNSVTNIGMFAFSWCDKLRKVVIPKSIIYIGKEIFNGCNNLTICFRGSKKDMKQFIKIVKPSLFRNKVVFNYID